MYVLFFTVLQQFPLKNLITEIIATCFETAAFITHYLCIGVWEINAPGNEMTHPGSLKMYVQVMIQIQAVDLHCVYCTIFFALSLSFRLVFFFFSFKPHPTVVHSAGKFHCAAFVTVIGIQPTIT